MKHLLVAVCGVVGLAAAMAAFAPEGHTTTCVGTITAHTLTITGTVATGTFTVAGAGCELKVGLATYKAANGQTFPANLPQTLYDSKTGVFGSGSHTLTVGVPSCYAQTDMFTGDVIENLSTSSVYGPRLLDAKLSGSTTCTTTTTTTTTTTQTTSTTPTTTTSTPTTSTSTVTTTVTVASPPVTTTVETPGPTTTVTVTTPAPAAVTTPPVTVTAPARTVTVKTPVRTRTVTVTRTVVAKPKKPVRPKAKKCRADEKLFRGSCHRIIRGKG